MLDDDAWRAVSELAASQHGCFTRNQAADIGIGRRRLERALGNGLLKRERPRVFRFAGAPPTWEAQLVAATLSTAGVASHRAAARLHRFDGFAEAPPEITIARGRMPRIDGLMLHRWTDPDSETDHVVVSGIPCTSIAVTLAQLGAAVDLQAVERALDEAMRRGVSLRWIQQTVERLHRPGPSGTHALLRILADERRSGRLPDSWFERVVQQILDAADVRPPILQHEVRVTSGVTYRLDMAWPDLLLGLECHSRRYHFGPLKNAADHRRDLELAGAGWEVLYDVGTPASSRRVRALSRRGPRNPRPSAQPLGMTAVSSSRHRHPAPGRWQILRAAWVQADASGRRRRIFGRFRARCRCRALPPPGRPQR